MCQCTPVTCSILPQQQYPPILPGPSQSWSTWSPHRALRPLRPLIRPLRLFLVSYHEFPVPTALTCPSPRFRKVKGDLSPQHVYIEDGTHQTREAAFKHYHFTMFCGDFSLSPFPPLALVYSLAYVAHVPQQGFWMLFAHLFLHKANMNQHESGGRSQDKHAYFIVRMYPCNSM